ncbi:MAG: 2OG-Fe(II) oxygenase [Gammaproteobacteria bacterium]|nr:2OG-Fe(II) oxygenase [Gammaproteobacteria bacterium]
MHAAIFRVIWHMEQLEEKIKPKAGEVAIFQHKIRHEGCKVIQGTKYALRTDVIYKKDHQAIK